MLKKIISGGQTGADRAGLEVARHLGLDTGGTAPKEWRICNPDGTDGSDPSLAEFGLVEHESHDYPPRTKQNVKDADGTVWFGYPDSPGGKLTIGTAKQLGKPIVINPDPEDLRRWIIANNIEVLNVAGSRASDLNPDIYERAYSVIWMACHLRPSICLH